MSVSQIRSSSKTLGLLAGAAFLFGAFIENHQACGQSQLLTVQDLLNGVLAQRAQIHDIGVSVTVQAVQANPNILGYDHRQITIEGAKFLVKREYSFLSNPSKVFVVNAAFDGTNSVVYSGSAKAAMIMHTGDIPEFDTHGSGLFDLMMYYPCDVMKGHYQPAALGLARLLALNSVALRPALETVNGFECHVLDEFDPHNGEIRTTVWIDAQHGFLPIRQRGFGHSNDLVVEYEIQTIAQMGGVWFPLIGTRKTPAMNVAENPALAAQYPALLEPSVFNISVDLDAANSPQLYVNTGVDEQQFSYVNALPVGTMVRDEQTDEQWIARNGNFDATARVALASLANQNQQPIAENGKVEASTNPTVAREQSPGRWSAAWFGLIGVFSVLGLVTLYRRHVA